MERADNYELMFGGETVPTELRGIGYWVNEKHNEYPHPKDWIKPNWKYQHLKDKIVKYLKNGYIAEAWMGMSHCRFNCDHELFDMGCLDLNDGIWVWPEGLTHYIEKHDIALPDLFVEHMIDNCWTYPEEITSAQTCEDYDMNFWIKAK